MLGIENHDQVEYAALMRRGQDAERSGQMTWIAGALVAAVTMSWAIAGHSPALLIPVVLAIAAGFYGQLRARQQVRLIGSYVEEFCEPQGRGRWFTRVHQLQQQPGYRAAGDWLTVALANAALGVTLILAWIYADDAPRGDLMAGIVTACGALFGWHSVMETVRLGQTDWGAMWRKTADARDAARTGRAA